MKATVELDPEVVAAAEQLQRENNIGLSDAVNKLARDGIARARKTPTPFVQPTADIGITIDVSNIGDTLDLLDAYDRGEHH